MIPLRLLRIRTNERFEVSRLELVGIADENHQVRNAVKRSAGGEEIVERERVDRGVAARRSSADDHSILVDQSLIDQILRRGDAVISVVDAPFALEGVAIHLAVPGRTAIVDVDNREPPASPVMR